MKSVAKPPISKISNHLQLGLTGLQGASLITSLSDLSKAYPSRSLLVPVIVSRVDDYPRRIRDTFLRVSCISDTLYEEWKDEVHTFTITITSIASP